MSSSLPAHILDSVAAIRSDRLVVVLRGVPFSDMEDAVQIAWLAHLEGRCAARAVDSWRRRESRRRASMRQYGTEPPAGSRMW